MSCYNLQVNDIRDFNANRIIIDNSFGMGLVFASFFGYSGSSKYTLSSLKHRKCDVRFLGRLYNTQPGDYNIYNTKVPDSDFYHIIVSKKDKLESISSSVNLFTSYIFLEVPAEEESNYLLSIIRNNPPQKLLDIIYKKIYTNSSLPFLKEWSQFILNKLIDENKIKKNTVMGEDDTASTVLISYTLNVYIEDLIDYISEGLRYGHIYIDKNCSKEPSDAMQAIEGLDGYLNTFTDILANRIQTSFKPRFTPNQDKYSQELLDFTDYVQYKHKMDLYPAQKDVIQSVSNCLDEKKSAFIIGSCGTGKTAMGTGVVIVNSKNRKTNNIVMCPAHLVKKWKHEIETLAPLSEAYIISNFHDLLKVAPKINNNHKRRSVWLIISKETAKFSYEEKPSAIWSNMKKCFICPECGKPLYKNQFEGRGKRKRKVPLFFTETSFLKKSIDNKFCINTVQKYNWNTGVYEKHQCNAKLWEPYIKNQSHSTTSWIKLGKEGWIPYHLMNQVKNKLEDKNELNKEEKSLLKAINEAVNKPPVQRAPKKYSIAKYIRQYFNNKIDYFIADEMHQLKGGDSAQGEAFGDLAFASKKIIGLTGTLLNGYASGLFYILYRTFSSLMQKEGFEYTDENKFTTEYGVVKKTSKYEWSNGMRKNKKGATKIKALPGVSPLVFTKFLLENAAFISQEDISTGLPAYTEIPIGIEMDDNLQYAYSNLESTVSTAMKDMRKGAKIMGQMIQCLSVYPDMPYNQPPIIHPDSGEVIVEPVSLDSSIIRNKDIKFLELIQKKKEDGEKVLVYYHWTNKTDLADRLPKLLKEHNIKTAVLKSSIKAELREEWINKQLENDIDVLICNPTLIETGLDLLDFTTIVYYQMGYNLYTMRQASRRSWRLSQKNDVEVYFLYYKNSIQEQALSLMATKLQASMAIEGKFSEEGLNALSNNEDIFSQIASSVAEGIKDTVDIQVFEKISVQNTMKKKLITQTKEENINNVSYLNFVNIYDKHMKSIEKQLLLNNTERSILNNPLKILNI